MTSRKPLITLVTVVFNGVKTLRSTIESIVLQLSDEVEYVIIDGSSTDGTVDIIREYEKILSYWVSEPDEGIYDAWNKAIAASRGTFISFIGADDTLESGALRMYIQHIKSAPNINYWSSTVALGSRNGRIVGRPWNRKDIRRHMTVAHVGSMHKRDLYLKYGHYDISFKIAGDYEFLLRVGKSIQAGYFKSVTVIMGVNGVSNRDVMKTLIETRRAKIITRSRIPVLAYFDFYFAIIKYYLRRAIWH
jgi:glycosyltransferase involved in cell wall biosynthesis